MLFVSHVSDAFGTKALEILQSLNRNTRLLKNGDSFPQGAVAIFTPLNGGPIQGKRGRLLRTSAIKLTDSYLPDWAKTSLFRIAIFRLVKPKRSNWPNPMRGLTEALKNAANEYAGWLQEGSTKPAPWTCAAANKATLAWAEKVAQTRAAFSIKPSAHTASDINTILVGQWTVNFSSRVIAFPAWAAEKAVAMLEEWRNKFTLEQTWARQKLAVPSLLVRFDCIVRNGQLVVYEIEERPAGLGISSSCSQTFATELKKASENWPEFRVEVSPLRRATDDHLWQQQVNWTNKNAELVLVRAEPEETIFHNLEGVSVSSLKAKGDKSYGEKMGWWKRVSHPDELPWHKAFVLKPLKGSKVRDLEFWDPQRRPGSSRQPVITGALHEHGAMYLQDLHAPMESGHQRFPWMIFRVFFAYNPGRDNWIALGGNWNARHNLKIHGASDAIFGPAPVE